jgi:hypothetical protein
MKRVVTGDQEASEIDQKLAGNVEEYEEKVDPHNAEDGVHLWHGGLAFEVVEDGVFGELRRYISTLINRILCAIEGN